MSSPSLEAFTDGLAVLEIMLKKKKLTEEWPQLFHIQNSEDNIIYFNVNTSKNSNECSNHHGTKHYQTF